MVWGVYRHLNKFDGVSDLKMQKLINHKPYRTRMKESTELEHNAMDALATVFSSSGCTFPDSAGYGMATRWRISSLHL